MNFNSTIREPFSMRKCLSVGKHSSSVYKDNKSYFRNIIVKLL